MYIMTLKMKFIQDPRLEFFEKKSSRLINILLLILFYIIGSTILSAIGSKNGHLLNTHKNLSICKTDFSYIKKPDITGLRICIALCIHTGRTFCLVNNTHTQSYIIHLITVSYIMEDLNYFKNMGSQGYILPSSDRLYAEQPQPRARGGRVQPHPFTDVNATTAKQHLRRWIAYCKPLSNELRSIGYNPAKHSISRNEVKMIVKHLGEP